MGIVIRKSLITSAISYLGVVIGYFNLLWLYPMALDPSQVGLFKVLQDLAILLVPFAQLGIGQSLVRFFPEFNKHTEGKKVLLTFALSASLMGYLLFLAIFYAFETPILSIFAEKSPEVIQYFGITLFLLLILVLQNILETYARSLLRIITINFIKDILTRLLSALAVSFYLLNYIDFNTLLNSLIIVYSLSLLVFTGYLVHLGEFKFSLKPDVLNKPLLKSFLQYGLITVIAGAGALIVQKIDSIMVTAMLGLAENGIYVVVFYIAVVIEIPRRAMAQIANPLIAHAFGHNNMMDINIIYRKSAINMLIIGLLLYMGIVANLDNIFDIMPNGEIYEAGKIVVIAIGLGKLMDMAAGVNGEIIVMSEFYKYNVAFIAVLAVVNIMGNFILIPLYGIAGAAIASAFSLVCFNIAKYIFIYFKFKIQPFSLNTIKTLLAGAGVFLLVGQIPQMDTILDILIRSTAITLAFGLLILGLKVSEDVNKTVAGIWNRLRK